MDVEEIRMEIDRIEGRQASLELLVIQCEQAREENARRLELLREQLSHAEATREIERELGSPITPDAVERLIDSMPVPKQLEEGQ